MKKLLLLSLVCCLTAALASPAAALRWPDNQSYRVNTMGGATLGIEDETTAITSFNHQNIAGVSLNKKENRSDLGLIYGTTTTEVEYPAPISTTLKDTTSDMELSRPGAEYRGITYWLDDNMVVRAGIEGMLMSGKTSVTTPLGTDEEGLSFSGLGGGASFGYLFDGGLAVGVGATYVGAGGKPDSLDGQFDVYGGGNTDKVEISASVLSWGLGVAYAMAGLGGEDNKLTLGVGLHSDDDRPNPSALAGAITGGGGISPLALGDYNLTLKTEGTVAGAAASDTMTLSQAPLFVSAEAILNIGSMLEAGLLFDYGLESDVKMKLESSNLLGSSSIEYKIGSISELVISPVVRANLALSEDMALLPGISFSTNGSGTLNGYSLNTTTPALDDVYKAMTTTYTQSLIGIGCGLQAMSKQLALAVQYETGSDKAENKYYDEDGTDITPPGIDPHEGSTSNMRVGAEYWIIPMLAIRAGFASLLHTTKDAAIDASGNVVDLKAMTNRISFGVGVNMPDGLRADLLVGLNTNTTDPAGDPAPTDTAMDILLGLKIPM